MKDLAVFFMLASSMSIFYVLIASDSEDEVNNLIILIMFYNSLIFSFLSGFFASRSRKIDLRARVLRAKSKI